MSAHPYSLIIHESVRNVKFFDERARNMVLFPYASHIKALAALKKRFNISQPHDPDNPENLVHPASDN